jgi:hypothetical protein
MGRVGMSLLYPTTGVAALLRRRPRNQFAPGLPAWDATSRAQDFQSLA